MLKDLIKKQDEINRSKGKWYWVVVINKRNKVEVSIASMHFCIDFEVGKDAINNPTFKDRLIVLHRDFENCDTPVYYARANLKKEIDDISEMEDDLINEYSKVE